MKKNLILLFVMVLTIILASCVRKKQPVVEPVADTLVVENFISTDKELVFLNYGEKYVWYETNVTLKNFLDEENNAEIEEVGNVFQLVEGDPEVVVTTHNALVDKTEIFHSFWIEDFDMSGDSIVVTFKEAFDMVMAVNLPKPHSKHVVLRKPIGPLPCNPQWVFGNVKSQIWIDAVTCEVAESNPAFPIEE